MISEGPFCVKILSFLYSSNHQLWLTVIDLLMSEPGLVDSGMVVTAKSHPCG